MDNNSRLGNLLKKYQGILTFRDIPLTEKFLLFSVGSLFWLVVTAAIGLVFMFYMNQTSTKMAEVNVPQSKTLNIILGKARGAGISAHKMALAENPDSVDYNQHQAVEAMEECRTYLKVLQAGGDIKDYTRDSSMPTRDFYVSPITGPKNKQLLEELITKTDSMQTIIMEIQGIKNKTGVKDPKELKTKIEEYDAAVLQFEFGINTLTSTLDKEWEQFSRTTTGRIKLAILLMSTVFLIAVGLYGVFGVLISRALRRPISGLINQIRSLSAGEVDLTKKLEVTSKDELGQLSEEFNKLMDTIAHVAHFKKVAEEDETAEDVYNRLGKIFNQDLGINKFLIYEVSNSKKNMTIKYPPELQGTEMNCSMDIQLDCELCRAKRTGHDVSSIEYPDICKYFIRNEGYSHICVPIIISGNVGGVAQFLCGGPEGCGIDFQNNISRARQYIREVQPVLESKRLMLTLKESAVKDAMTGLYNRRFLEESYESIVAGLHRRKTNLGILMCDLDFFKKTNDVYGHDVGDLVLKETSEIIRRNVRSADFVVRFGGEEFLVLLMDTSTGDAMQVADKIRAKIEEHKVTIVGGIIQKTISIGVSEFPSDTQNFWEGIKFADVALYKAKEKGRNKVVRFTDDMWTEERY